MSSHNPQFLSSLVAATSRQLQQRLLRIPDIESNQNHRVALRTSFRLCQTRFEAVGVGLSRLPASVEDMSTEEALRYTQIAVGLCDEISLLLERDMGFLLRVLDKYKALEEKPQALIAESIVTELLRSVLSVAEGINAYVAGFELAHV